MQEELGESLKHIKETLRQISNKGIGYGPLVSHRGLPRISFNYLGQFDGERTSEIQENTWRIVGKDSGLSANVINHDHNFININGLVIDGSLQFNIATKFSIENARLFASLFKESLEEVIRHTTEQTRTYLTVSDVNGIISQKYLDKIQKTREVAGVYKANSLQQGFIYHSLSQGTIDDAYRVQLIWEYGDKTIPSYLKEAWENAQRRYSSLRLRFGWDEELIQVID